MSQLIFTVGNVIAVIGGFWALAWAATNSRFYWRKRRRGIAALVFLAFGLYLMYLGSPKTSAPASSPGIAIPSLRMPL